MRAVNNKTHPYTEYGMNAALHDNTLVTWAKHHHIYNNELQSLYDEWVTLCDNYSKLEFIYCMSKIQNKPKPGDVSTCKKRKKRTLIFH
jgi:hypothetical protein